jgi:hypothetical protein
MKTIKMKRGKNIPDVGGLRKLVGGLSKPGKMPGWSIGIPAKECKTGSKLRAVKGSVCEDCYALKGCYVFKVVQDAQYRRLKAIYTAPWVQAMVTLINSKSPTCFAGTTLEMYRILNI